MWYNTFVGDNMFDIRKLVIIFIIALLFSAFTATLIEAIYPTPKYSDFCNYKEPPMVHSKDCPKLDPALSYTEADKDRYLLPTEKQRADCNAVKGILEATYDSKGCITGYKCNSCNTKFISAKKKHNLLLFIINSITGLLAIVISLYLPSKRDITKWIGTGFLLGGLFNIFVGTIVYFREMPRYLRPVVLLIELIIVVYLSYKKLDTSDSGIPESKSLRTKKR